MSAITATLEVARSNVAARVAQRAAGRPPQRRGRPPLPEEALLADIKTVIAGMPTYGYARVWALLRRKARAEGHPPINRKRVYRVMRAHDLLLERHASLDLSDHPGRRADLTRRAIPALKAVTFDEGLLQRMKCPVRCQTFVGGDRASFVLDREGEAGENAFSVDEDGQARQAP